MKEIILSDNLTYLRTLPDNSVDSVVTDPPYGLKFMGKQWDYDVPKVELWQECLRVLKPGGFLLSFFGTRTFHRGVVRIEDAGFEIRDQIQWIYGSGFPKSKSCLKPANEPICVARRSGPMLPLNIDECRVNNGHLPRSKSFGDAPSTLNAYGQFAKRTGDWVADEAGRYPSNVMLDEAMADLLDEQSGISGGDKRQFKAGVKAHQKGEIFEGLKATNTPAYNDIGGASRFFYVAKASQSERNKGISTGRNTHPTVKPVSLMRHLVKLVTPMGGVCLDPHAGSCTTAIACELEGFGYVLIDNDPVAIAEGRERIAAWKKEPDLFN
jgi:DNA modification methylase